MIIARRRNKVRASAFCPTYRSPASHRTAIGHVSGRGRCLTTGSLTPNHRPVRRKPRVHSTQTTAPSGAFRRPNSRFTGLAYHNIGATYTLSARYETAEKHAYLHQISTRRKTRPVFQCRLSHLFNYLSPYAASVRPTLLQHQGDIGQARTDTPEPPPAATTRTAHRRLPEECQQRAVGVLFRYRALSALRHLISAQPSGSPSGRCRHHTRGSHTRPAPPVCRRAAYRPHRTTARPHRCCRQFRPRP